MTDVFINYRTGDGNEDRRSARPGVVQPFRPDVHLPRLEVHPSR